MHKTTLVAGYLMSSLIAVATACGAEDGMDNYREAVRSGFALIPESLQMEKLGECDHFIHSSGTTWNSEVYFGDRYCLSMELPITVNKQFSKVVRADGPPKFFFFEISGVTSEKGQLAASFRPQAERHFTAAEWDKVVKAKMDFGVLGITINKEPVKRFQEYVAAVRRDIVKVRPDVKSSDTKKATE